MTIKRVDFIGMSVLGPNMRAKDSYRPDDWPKWTASVEGPQLVLEGEGRRIEVPKARCVVYIDKPEAAAVMARAQLEQNAKGKRLS